MTDTPPQSQQHSKHQRFTVATHQPSAPAPAPPQPVSRIKEQEPVTVPEAPQIEEVGIVEVAPEIKEAGVVVKSETVEIPPDVGQLGVTHAGYSSPITPQQPTGPRLPLSDDKIAVGLHARVLESIRWLAEWCVKQLKKGHWVIRNTNGHITRVRE